MKVTVYLDILLVTNLIINYFLLKTAALYCKANVSTGRMLWSSVAGAFFSITVFFSIPFWLMFIIRCVSVFICGVIAFGIRQKLLFVKALIYLFVGTFCFTGLITIIFQNNSRVFVNNMYIYLNINPMILVCSILAVYLILYSAEFIYEGYKREYIYNIEIICKGKKLKGMAFYDTGFKINDVITFKTVMLTSYKFIESILPGEISSDINRFYSSGTYTSKDILPLFYSDLSNNGMLPAITAEKVIISGSRTKKIIENVLIGISPNKISEDFDMIFGKDIYIMAGVEND